MNAKHAGEVIVGFVMNTVAWIAGSEQIWFGAAMTYFRIKPLYGLPDLRGPFLLITMLYAGLRLADWLEAREEIEEIT